MTNEGRFARLEIANAGSEIDDLVGDLGGVGVFADLVAEQAERGQGILPASLRDPVRDAGDDALPVARLLGGADVATHPGDRVAG